MQVVQQQVDNSYKLLGIVLVHDAQAIDLHRQMNKHFTLSKPIEALYNAVPEQVAFMALILSNILLNDHQACCCSPGKTRGQLGS